MGKPTKEIKGIVDQAYDLVQKILRWRSMRLESALHIKYEPHKASGQSHFEAIMADVNEEYVKMEEQLKLHSIADSLATEQHVVMEGLSDVDMTYEKDPKVKAQLEHKKRLKEEKEMVMHRNNHKK